jgi:glyoxylase-like metal-dependent hydrolase (beta-lactamase superfamily II)
MTPKTVGQVRVDSILESQGLYRDPLEMYADATREVVNSHRSWLEPHSLDPATGQLILAFQSYLVRTPRRTILIDTCVGEDKERPGRPNWHRAKWPWLANLKAAGVEPEEIDFVMCTHLHIDHVGWNTRLQDGKWVPTFPNARYLFAETEYRHWEAYRRHDEMMRHIFEDSVLPVMEAGKATLVKSDHEVDSGIWLEPTPGHTPGHVCIHVESQKSHAIFTGDMMHHPIQVAEPQWSSMFCSDKKLSAATRTAFVEKHADTSTLILPAHFPNESAGHVISVGPKMRFRFAD